MKKLFVYATAGLFLIGLVACGGGSSEKATMEKMVSVFEDYVTDIEKVESADDVVAAIEKFSAGMEKLKPELQAMKEKYEGKDFMKEPPPELADVSKKLGEVMGRMMGASMKLMKYANDPKVQEAQKKLAEAMAGMD